MNKTKLYLRADGNSNIGLGHLMRCKALADILRDNFECIFIVNNPDNAISQMVEICYSLISISFNNLKEELLYLQKILCKKDILVADGYQFDHFYQTKVRSMVNKFVMVDDKAEHYFDCDVIFNHGDISVLPKYNKTDSTILYAGLDYLILRNEFLKASKESREIKSLESAFICMGGADPFDATIKVANAVAQCGFIKKLTVVTGSAYEKSEALERILKDFNFPTIHAKNLTAKKLVSILKKSDLAITTSSTIALEVCCVKSVLLTGIVVDNQMAIHSILTKTGSCYSIDNLRTVEIEGIINTLYNLNNSEIIQSVIKNQSLNFDGKSAERIVSIFKDLAA